MPKIRRSKDLGSDSDSESSEEIASNNFIRYETRNKILANLNEKKPSYTIGYFPESNGNSRQLENVLEDFPKTTSVISTELPRIPSPIDTSIDPLVRITATLNTPIRNTTAHTMAQDLNLLKFRLSSLTNYDGSPEGLNNFIFSCQQVTQHYPNSADTSLIILHLKSKLISRAALQLGTRNYRTYDDFFNDLKQAFSLGKDLNSYRSDIVNAYKRNGQNALEFASEIRRLLDLAYDFVQASNYSPEEKVTICRELDHIAIERIIYACHHDLQRHFFTVQPDSIATVIREIQRDMAFTQRNRQRVYEPHDRHNYRAEPQRPPPRQLPPPAQHFTPRQYTPPPMPPRPNTFPSRPMPPKPAFQSQQRQHNGPASGRYANSQVMRPNTYPRPYAFNHNHNNNNYGNQNRNFQPNNFGNNPSRPPNNFNRPPPRPATQHPATPMEVNTHDYNYDPYEEYYYQDEAFYHQYDTQETQQDYDYNDYGLDPQNTQPITEEMNKMNINQDPTPAENSNFRAEASDSQNKQ